MLRSYGQLTGQVLLGGTTNLELMLPRSSQQKADWVGVEDAVLQTPELHEHVDASPGTFEQTLPFVFGPQLEVPLHCVHPVQLMTVPTQSPVALHLSVCVQALPSSQDVPAGSARSVQPPLRQTQPMQPSVGGGSSSQMGPAMGAADGACSPDAGPVVSGGG